MKVERLIFLDPDRSSSDESPMYVGPSSLLVVGRGGGRGASGLRKAVPAGAMALASMLTGLRTAGAEGRDGEEAATCTTSRDGGEDMLSEGSSN